MRLCCVRPFYELTHFLKNTCNLSFELQHCYVWILGLTETFMLYFLVIEADLSLFLCMLRSTDVYKILCSKTKSGPILQDIKKRYATYSRSTPL